VAIQPTWKSKQREMAGYVAYQEWAEMSRREVLTGHMNPGQPKSHLKMAAARSGQVKSGE